jgi:hypothetical protein
VLYKCGGKRELTGEIRTHSQNQTNQKEKEKKTVKRKDVQRLDFAVLFSLR